MTLKWTFAIAALLCGAAQADGVSLFKPGPALAASDAVRITMNRPVKSLAPVIVDSRALESTILTVDLGGKTYRFVGAKRVLPPSLTLKPGSREPSVDEEGGDYWEGKTAEGDTANISSGKRGVSGQFLAGGKYFHLLGGALLEIEPGRNARPMLEAPTPEMIEASRKRIEERRKVEEAHRLGVRP